MQATASEVVLWGRSPGRTVAGPGDRVRGHKAERKDGMIVATEGKADDMRILGIGVPELLILVVYPLIIALFAAIGYLVVKKAVKKAIIEAHDEIEARGKQG